MLAKGHEIVACAGEPRAEVVQMLRRWGAQFVPIQLSRTGMRPWEDLRTGWRLYRLIREFQPDVMLTYTIKPVIWGGFAAQFVKIPRVYSLITGLGHAFVPSNTVRSRVLRLFVSFLYMLSLKYSRVVFFQNPDDMEEFTARGLVEEAQCLIVNGSGVDLEYYNLVSLPSVPAPRFLMICRLLEDKGLREYIAAACMIQARHPEAKFRLAGPLDWNPASVSQEEVEQWKKEGDIDYLGVLEDVRLAFADCSIYVLPSLREGTPRTVLEAMSMGRAIITTNAPGCRETVRMRDGQPFDKSSKDLIEGENGFLVPPRNAEKLAQAMERFICHPELIQRMGRRSREIAEEKYDVQKVNAVMIRAMGLE
jgi:glycosyltransferase involved in cell wall biosynthesis